ncbi:MAG: PfkB family carbohydrate kinase [Bryobacterales bacterium]
MAQDAPTGLFVGLSTLDFVFGVEGFPKRNTKNIVAEMGLFAGGPAANAAVAFAALGGRARLETVIGLHPLGSAIRDDLERHGVEPIDRAPEHAGLPPLASILVSRPGGDRTAVSTASTGLPETEFDPRDFEPKPDVVLIDAHLTAQCVAAARHAKALGVPVVYDAGHWKPGLEVVCESVDYAICSETFFPPGCQSGKRPSPGLRAGRTLSRHHTRRSFPFSIGRARTGRADRGRNHRSGGHPRRGRLPRGAFSFALAAGASFTDALPRCARGDLVVPQLRNARLALIAIARRSRSRASALVADPALAGASSDQA